MADPLTLVKLADLERGEVVADLVQAGTRHRHVSSGPGRAARHAVITKAVGQYGFHGQLTGGTA